MLEGASGTGSDGETSTQKVLINAVVFFSFVAALLGTVDRRLRTPSGAYWSHSVHLDVLEHVGIGSIFGLCVQGQ